MSADTGPVAAPPVAIRFTPMLKVAPFTTRSGRSSVGAHVGAGAAKVRGGSLAAGAVGW